VTAQQLTDESNKAVDKGLGFFKTFLLIFAFVALFVGAFIIYNTFGIVVSQRTKELALLRALGASGRQVLASVIGESVILGFVASLIGLGAGVLIAAGLKAVLAGFGFDVPSGSLVILPRTVLVALIGGTAITTISAIAPAVRASRVPPIAAMSDVVVTRRGTAIRRNVVGLVLAVAGVVLIIWGLGGGTVPAVGIGALLTFVGVAMLAPMLARPVAGFAGRPIAETRGVAGMLARQNAMRSARRTAATASALMIGTALMAGSLILSRSTTRSIDQAVSNGVHSDLIVSTDNQIGFSPTFADQVKSVPGVQYVASYRNGKFKIGDATKSITGFPAAAMDPTSPQYAFDVNVREGDTGQLGGDTIAVRRKTAEDRGWKLGQDVTVTFPTGPQVLRIVALYDRNTLAGDYIVGLDTFEQHFADQNDFLVSLKLAPGADLRTVQSSVRQLVDTSFPGLKVQDLDQYSSDVQGRINQFLGLITALLALAILIALLGVLITMLLAVYERTRELGLLRAVGMARRQMRSMVRWEAAIVAAYGAVLGLLLGLFFGLALTTALKDQGITERVVPVPLLLLLAVVIAVLGVVAAIYPARRAARLNVLDAISHP
jgi:putative ABC transport system permease protein